MEVHLRAHTGETPFFSRKEHLKTRHIGVLFVKFVGKYSFKRVACSYTCKSIVKILHFFCVSTKDFFSQ